DDRGLCGGVFGGKGVRIALQAVDAEDLGADEVLVERAGADVGQEDLPDAAVAQAHGVAADVPIVEVAGDADHFGVGGPYGEADSGDEVDFDQMRAQGVPGLVVGALGVEVQVEAAEQG